jgi:hypothetical protein
MPNPTRVTYTPDRLIAGDFPQVKEAKSPPMASTNSRWPPPRTALKYLLWCSISTSTPLVALLRRR